MLTREELLEAVNELNSRYAGSKVGYINGYHDQWFLGGYVYKDEPDRQEVNLHFCQGRSVGRINSSGGCTVILNVTACERRREVFEEFRMLDPHRRREKEKADALRIRLEARCLRCVHYLGRLTGNCTPSAACDYKRIRPRKGGVKMDEGMVEAIFGQEEEPKELCF